METAHGLGMRTTATMMFGQGETFDQRVEHLDRLREVQDRTGGFTAFIPWTFQPRNTRMEMPEASSDEYLKFLALCRLYLDNIENIQASWVTQVLPPTRWAPMAPPPSIPPESRSAGV